MSKGKFAVGALIGAVAGFVAGIITAPKSGKETRAEIKVAAGDVKANVTDKINKVTSEAGIVVDDVKAKAEDVSEDVIAKTNELKGRTERAIDGAKKGFFSKK